MRAPQRVGLLRARRRAGAARDQNSGLGAAPQRALDGLLETRRVAQRSRDYGFADQLRDELAKIGVVVNDRMRSYSLEMASEEAGEMLSWLERRWASGRPRE